MPESMQYHETDVVSHQRLLVATQFREVGEINLQRKYINRLSQ